MKKKYDFSGWATRNNIRCSDGRTIMKNAFKHNDGTVVPLVWNHRHDESNNVLGNATLENRDEGVYAFCRFNNTESGRNAKLLVQHGDVSALSIYANDLKEKASSVFHGAIREVSLVLSGANPGAFIDSVIRHSADGKKVEETDEAIIYSGEAITLYHADDPTKRRKREDDEEDDEDLDDEEEADDTEDDSEDDEEDSEEQDEEDSDDDEEETKSAEEVFETLNDEQKVLLYALVKDAEEHAKDNDDDEEEEEKTVKHNVFNKDPEGKKNVLSHSKMTAIISDAKRYGSLKDSVLQHGITNIENLFPDEKAIQDRPDFFMRDITWVETVMNGVHHTPFARVKSSYADITADEARAKGYIKGNQKLEEVIVALKRSTTPTTIYKKQRLDRDDLIDITDFDVVAWIKEEMRMLLDEEIARAILVGDGRSPSSDDKINEQNIRPVWTDDPTYTIKAVVPVAPSATADQKAKAFIRSCVKERKNYKGSGSPILFTTEDVLTDCLLLEDKNGRVIYDTMEKLSTALRVSKIVTSPIMENLTRVNENSEAVELMGIILNLNDYNVGADKGGAVAMFDDFDIDYNAQKYLIETRCSGALIRPKAAIALELVLGEVAGEPGDE